jgi:pimeloyl-ACP methyl ester carboxylesterase
VKAYLIPGAFEDLKSRDYQAVLDVYKKHGYEPEFVRIDWKYKTIDDWLEQVKTKIPKKNLGRSLLGGFSWGAMIALTVASEYTNPNKLFLFDLSPYFSEDLESAKGWWLKWAGKKRVESFKRLRINDLAGKIICPTVLFLGVGDRKGLARISKRVKDANHRISGSRLVTIKDVGHDVADPKYVKAVDEALN